LLEQQDGTLPSIEIAGMVFETYEVSDAQDVAVRRALRKLRDAGRIVDLGRGFRMGRRHWATPERAERYFKAIDRAFGASAEREARAKASGNRR
jgi:hypothetical protein